LKRVVIVFIEQYDLYFLTAKSFYYFHSTETSSDDYYAGFAQVRDTRARGYQFGHLKTQKCIRTGQIYATAEQLT
jgi:hypothetical protein